MNYIDNKEFQEKIGYSFKNEQLLSRALTHTSYANELKINNYGHYERTEFLGDAVLELISSEYLFENYPDMPEGKLTKLRASLVCEFALAGDAKAIDLQKYILLGKGEEQTGGRGKDSIIADVLEAVIGAIYLDSGIDEARKFIQRFILNEIEKKHLFYDSKSILQEESQKRKLGGPQYRLVSESGPEHEKEFTVEVLIAGEILGKAAGCSKKAAEQKAAFEALLKLRSIVTE